MSSIYCLSKVPFFITSYRLQPKINHTQSSLDSTMPDIFSDVLLACNWILKMQVNALTSQNSVS